MSLPALPRSPASSRYRRLRAAALLSAGLLALGACKRTPPAHAGAAAPVPVTMARAETRDMPLWVEGLGTVQPLNVVEVKSRVDGQLQQVAFREGQMVKAGELLAQIDPRPFRIALAQAQANLRRDDAQHANAELDLQRYARLSATQAVAAQQLDAQRAQAQALLATVSGDRSAVDDAQLQLGFTRIVAPISGRVGQRLVDAGSQVHASDATGLVTITQLAPITVAFRISQDALPAVLRAQATGNAGVVALSRDGRQPLAEGTLVFVDSQVDPASGQVLLKAQFDNADNALWPGEFVAARLRTGTQANAVTVPAAAVQRDQEGAFVYVVGADRRVQMRPVQPGVTVDGQQALDHGLKAGETVVLDGQSRLSPGDAVKPATADAAPAAQAAGAAR